MSQINFDLFNQTIQTLPELAAKMAPTDATIPYLTTLLPATVTIDNAKQAMIVMALISRKVAIIFNDLAAEQEKLVQEWQS